MLFSENWAVVGRFRRLMSLLLNGRDTIVHFSPVVSLREIADETINKDDLREEFIHAMQKHVEVDEPEPTDMPLLTSNVPGSVGEQTAGGEDVVEFEQMTEEELLRGLEGMPPAESPGSQRNGY